MTRVTSSTSRTNQLSPLGEKLVGLRKPRKKLQGYQQWQVENRETADAAVQDAWQKKLDGEGDPSQEGKAVPHDFRQAIV